MELLKEGNIKKVDWHCRQSQHAHYKSFGSLGYFFFFSIFLKDRFFYPPVYLLTPSTASPGPGPNPGVENSNWISQVAVRDPVLEPLLLYPRVHISRKLGWKGNRQNRIRHSFMAWGHPKRGLLHHVPTPNCILHLLIVCKMGCRSLHTVLMGM